MKANEAPEEIYLLPDDRNPNGLSICWYEAPYRTGAIEYTRTDAFIEKACEWIKENLQKHTYVYEGEVGIGMDVFLKEFKQAMKGE